VKINFTPGPSQLYFTVEDHTKRAFREGIPSISHRSKQFENIYSSVKEGLTSLLDLPNSYHILFTSSATEIWERSIQNLVANTSHHYVNGAFSSRYFEIATQLGKSATKTEVKEGLGFTDSQIPTAAELIALTHNETSTGVSLTPEFIHGFRSKYPEALIAVDAVSSLPYPAFDYHQVDSVFFSVQKAFGLPAGLGVWLVNERCLEKASLLQSKGLAIGTYHSLPSLAALEKKNQTPETPNVLGIYLLSKILDDFNRRGITSIRRETEYKAAILYQALDNHPKLKSFVVEPSHRSKTVLVAECGTDLPEIVTALQSKELFPGDGYGKFKSTQLRFANFPTHSKEQFELLVDTLATL
jgi:phosphoserine aminotransferase